MAANFFIQILAGSFLLVGLTNGIHQELILHESETHDRNYYVIRDNIPDASFLPLENIKSICFRGGWDLYFDTGYFNHGDGSNSLEVRCVNQTFPFKSFRHPGSSDTMQDGISLYLDVWAGSELFVNQFPFTGNTFHVASLGFTGTSNFTLHQGMNLDGPNYCLQADPKGFSWLIPSDNGITTVGSISKGCYM